MRDAFARVLSDWEDYARTTFYLRINQYAPLSRWIFLFFLVFLVPGIGGRAQITGNFTVAGNINDYYPVVFIDHAWENNVATEMTLGRSSVHTNANWQGALIAKFRFHTTMWGNGPSFFDADVRANATGPVTITNFVGGWADATILNTSEQMVIWLRGGTTTYYYSSNFAVNPVVYDGVANSLPFVTADGGTSYTLKTTPDAYVNVNGINVNSSIAASGNLSSTGSLSVAGTGNNYIAGALSIGSSTPGSNKLAVEGTIGARKVVVTLTNPFPDYVFDRGYALPSLRSLSNYILVHHRLPELPSADSVARVGLDLGGNQTVLVKKIEELTLYILEQDKVVQGQTEQLKAQRQACAAQQEKIDRLEKWMNESILQKKNNGSAGK